MFKKFSPTALVIVLVVLAGIAVLNKFYFSKKSESTFNSEFVSIDTDHVSEILIYPKAENGKEIKLTRQAGGWELSNDKVKTKADSAAVRNLIAGFANITSNALAGADKSSWAGLQVDDSSGSRIKILTSDSKTFDMVVGKFGYNAATRNGVTYIRHTGEESVYAIDGFLSFSVNQPFSGWRNKTFIAGDKENWSSLTFTYPGDSSFALQKQDNRWLVNGQRADSAKTAQYLGGISTLQNNSFADSYTPSSTPVFTLSIQGNNLSAPITVTAYPADSATKFILHSSLNPDAYFSDAQPRMAEKIFVGCGSFAAQ
jgi:hypothetical protein